MGLFEKHRVTPAWKHEDPKIRRVAVGEMEDPSLLGEIARTDPDERVREEAVRVLHGLALEGEPEVALTALEGLEERKHLVSVARSAVHETVGRSALARLDDAKALGSVARQGRHVAICLEALGRISEPEELAALAQKSDQAEVALAALERVGSLQRDDLLAGAVLGELLTPVVQRARSKAAARRARAMLNPGKSESTEGQAPWASFDRRRPTALCEAMEALGRAEGSKHLAARISQTRQDWIGLLPDVDEDLVERFDRALRSAREQLAHNQAELEERRRREHEAAEFRARQIAPRQALCEEVESAPVAQAEAVLKDARFEWERLGPLDTDEGQALRQRFEAACATCERRHQGWQEEQTAARLRAEREAVRKERERRQETNRLRVAQLCDRLAGLIGAETPSLKRMTRGMRELEAALDDPGPLSSREERAALVKRLKEIHAALAPKLREVRESEEWKHWANAGLQEELCGRAEALSQLESAEEAARRLLEIQEQWRKASQVSGERARTLWQRFKSARDGVRSRLEAHRAAQRAGKESLCAQAEALAESTEWIRTPRLLETLRVEWKKIGASGPAQDRALWERFRKACDRFFTRRKEDRKQRRREWARNREAQEALCAEAEALADSTDWQATAGALKKLQANWKAIGPSGRKESEALWQRFRGACSRFFERYRRRDILDRERQVAERVGLCRELEALLPDPEGTAPAPDGLLETFRTVVKRWQEGGSIPGPQAAEIQARFDLALDRLIAAYPEKVRGSEWDVEENRRRMEELCSRVEKLLTQEMSLDDSAASPASRLAAQWVEAMAANTIGGKVGDDARWRAAAEDVKKAQAAWHRIGYVPEEPRRALAGRFERACRRFFDLRGRS